MNTERLKSNLDSVIKALDDDGADVNLVKVARAAIVACRVLAIEVMDVQRRVGHLEDAMKRSDAAGEFNRFFSVLDKGGRHD